MSRYGDEMVAELASLLNKHGAGLDKTAAKKEDKEEKEDKKDKKEEKEKAEKEEKAEKKEEKKEKADKKKKKAEFMAGVLDNLVKLAEELDAAGAGEAASLVDDALKVIVKNIKDGK